VVFRTGGVMGEGPDMVRGSTPLPDRPVDDAGTDDMVLPFQVSALDVRGRVVRLGPAVDVMLRRHGYPAAVSRVIGEAAALTALLGTALKFEGRFQLQTKTDGAIDLLVIDFDAPDRLRGYARFDLERVTQLAASPGATTSALLGTGYLAMTIDQGNEMSRYQGVVALEGQSLEDAAHQYFRQSEQIPTRIRLAVGEAVGVGSAPSAWRAGGLIVQFLPRSPERQRQRDFDPGDAPEGVERPVFQEDDAWLEAKALADTVEDHELLDPLLSSERLLYRLFHERGVMVFPAQPVREACRCSRDRIIAMFRRFSADDRAAMVGDDGKVGVTCEFCSTGYVFEPSEIEAAIEAVQ
jgi:molecular chaperone Hsp33